MHLPGKKKDSEGNQSYKAMEWHWHKKLAKATSRKKLEIITYWTWKQTTRWAYLSGISLPTGLSELEVLIYNFLLYCMFLYCSFNCVSKINPQQNIYGVKKGIQKLQANCKNNCKWKVWYLFLPRMAIMQVTIRLKVGKLWSYTDTIPLTPVN